MKFQSLILGILLLPLCACGQFNSSSAYDPSKASLLTEEKRREYDVLLANELATWNTNTTRCNREAHTDPDCRERFFRELAADGYEIADIVSQIYFPRKGVIRANREAYERLHRLAEAGDTSALCFAPYVFGRLIQEDTQDWPYTGESEAVFTQKGMALDLPLCAINEFYYYWNGAYGYPEDRDIAHKRLLKAAEKGLFFAQKNLMLDYQRDGFSDLIKIRKALCWGRLADQHSPNSWLDGYVDNLRINAWARNGSGRVLVHPEFMQLAREWDPRFTPHGSKETKINECVQIEKEK